MSRRLLIDTDGRPMLVGGEPLYIEDAPGRFGPMSLEEMADRLDALAAQDANNKGGSHE